VAAKKHCRLQSNLENHIFGSIPWRVHGAPLAGLSGATASRMRDAVSGADLRPCTKFLPNPFSSFGEMRPKQTDRQTDKGQNLLSPLLGDKYFATYAVVKLPLDARERSSRTSNYWDPASHTSNFIKTLDGLPPPVAKLKTDVQFCRLRYSILNSEHTLHT